MIAPGRFIHKKASKHSHSFEHWIGRRMRKSGTTGKQECGVLCMRIVAGAWFHKVGLCSLAGAKARETQPENDISGAILVGFKIWTQEVGLGGSPECSMSREDTWGVSAATEGTPSADESGQIRRNRLRTERVSTAGSEWLRWLSGDITEEEEAHRWDEGAIEVANNNGKKINKYIKSFFLENHRWLTTHKATGLTVPTVCNFLWVHNWVNCLYTKY